MNTFYVVTPVALLAAFAAYVLPANARLDEALAQRAALAEQNRIEQKQQQDEALRTATAEQKRLAEVRAQEQAAKEMAARELEAKRDQALSEDLKKARQSREALRSALAALEARERDLSAARDQAEARLHADRTALELRRIERRNADLELERLTLLLAATVEANLDTSAGVFPAPSPR